MKMSKQELKQRISDSIEDEDLVISLLEDIEDSMIENNEQIIDETQKKELEDLKFKYEDLKQKYKDRFLTSNIKDEKKDEIETLEEKEVIDVKEI